MNISVLIIEDCLEDTQLLVEFLKQIPTVIKIQTYASAEEALSDLIGDEYNLLFLDIELANLNGLDLLQTLPLPPTIVVSNHLFYAAPIFDIDSVLDFIQKPLTFVRLLRALKRFQTASSRVNVKQLFLKVGRQVQSFKANEIYYIEAQGIYSKVFMKDGRFTLVNDNISEIESKLVNTNLVRLHKSYIFNIDFITAFDSRNIWLNELKFSLGGNYRNKVGELLNLDGFHP
jgi:hypothetical protein